MKIVKNWQAAMHVTEQERTMEAELVLKSEDWTFDCSAESDRVPGDPAADDFCHELAAGRALVSLGNRLIAMADLDVEERASHRAASST